MMDEKTLEKVVSKAIEDSNRYGTVDLGDFFQFLDVDCE